jgi:ATP-dependent DNA helicase RecG
LEAEVESQIQQGAGDQTAFLPERADPAAVAETLSALANARGGTLLLGVTRAGAVRGVRDPDAQGDKALSAALLVEPPIVLPMPRYVTLRGQAIVAVQVPAGLPNVYQLGGHFLIRDGAENRSLRLAEVHQLMTQRGVTSFESLPVHQATLDDLDWEHVRQYVNRLQQAADPDPTEVLRRRGCLVSSAGADAATPTHAGLLLFGVAPSGWLPSACITAVRYPGTEMGDRFMREEIRGSLPDQIRKAEAFLLANVTQEVALAGWEQEQQATYPKEVLREVVVNAVAHRDYVMQGENIRIFCYADRVEVYSPGRLPGHVTVENIVDERFSRNPVLVQVLADLGFVERLGYGIDRMLRLLDQAGQPPPRFEETAAGFRVTLYPRQPPAAAAPRRWAHLDLGERQEKALQYVIDEGRITNREYQSLCPDVSAETIRRDLADLVHKDLLLRIGRKRATYYILKDANLAER